MNDECDLVTLPQLIEARPFLTQRWVRTLVQRGVLPHYKPAGRLLFSLAEVDDWARSEHPG